MIGAPATIVFIHGMYLNGHSWQAWEQRASARGYSCLAPSWPYHEGDPGALRERIDPHLGTLTLGAVADHLKDIIGALPDRPYLVGHSIGGLLVQKLVHDGVARAGVAISSAPARGIVSLDPHFYRANVPHINPFALNHPVIMTKKRFRYTFCNTMDRQASDEAHERYVVPESRNVPRSTLTRQGRIDFRAEHAPLLFIAGDRDHLTPLAMVKRNARAYKASGGVIDFEQFTHRSHFICNQDGWEAVADLTLDWLARH